MPIQMLLRYITAIDIFFLYPIYADNLGGRKNPEGSFHFTVTDGDMTTPEAFFRVLAQDLELNMAPNRVRLEVFPQTTQIIYPEHLLALTKQPNMNGQITYVVKLKPRNGKLVRLTRQSSFPVNKRHKYAQRYIRAVGISTDCEDTENMSELLKVQQFRVFEEDINSFTQAEVNESKIAYIHTGIYSHRTHGEISDIIHFELQAQNARTLQGITLTISISYDNVNMFNQAQLLHMQPLRVTEGGIANITDLHLLDQPFSSYVCSDVTTQGSTVFILRTLPRHGRLLFSGTPLIVGDSFAKVDLYQMRIQYHHDGSNSQKDNFEIAIRRLSNRYGVSADAIDTRENVLFTINIDPVNDENFQITSLNDLHVFNRKTMLLTANHLKTTDADNTASELVYEVSMAPTKGSLINRGIRICEERQAMAHQCSFTQEDIDLGRLVYSHTDVTENSMIRNDFFYFCVSDGKHQKKCHNFNIIINPILLHLTSSTLYIPQGQRTVLITKKNLNGSCNDPDLRSIVYQIVQSSMGRIYFDEVINVSNFTQSQINERRLTFRQLKMDQSSGTIQLIAVTGNGNARQQSIFLPVVVRPLVKWKGITFRCDNKSKALHWINLQKSHLDAEELSRNAGAPVLFEVIRNLTFAEVRYYSGTGAGAFSQQEVMRFKQSDVNHKNIYIVMKGDIYTWQSRTMLLQDNLTLSVSAIGKNNFQPALLNLTLHIQPCLFSPTENPLVRVDDKKSIPSAASVDEFEEGRILGLSQKTFITVVLVVGVLFVAMILLILIKCVPRRNHGASGMNTSGVSNGTLLVLKSSPRNSLDTQIIQTDLVTFKPKPTVTYNFSFDSHSENSSRQSLNPPAYYSLKSSSSGHTQAGYTMRHSNGNVTLRERQLPPSSFHSSKISFSAEATPLNGITPRVNVLSSSNNRDEANTKNRADNFSLFIRDGSEECLDDSASDVELDEEKHWC